MYASLKREANLFPVEQIAKLRRELPLFSVERISSLLNVVPEDLELVIPTRRGVEVMLSSGQSYVLGTHNFKSKVGRPVLRYR